MKRILSILLVVVMLGSLLAGSVSAAGGYAYGIKTDRSQLRAGETVTVTVSLDANAGLCSVAAYLSFPDSVFSLKSVTVGTTIANLATPSVEDNESGKALLDLRTNNLHDTTATGDLGVFELQVKDDAPLGEATISFTTEENYTENDDEVDIPSVSTTVYITHDHVWGTPTSNWVEDAYAEYGWSCYGQVVCTSNDYSINETAVISLDSDPEKTYPATCTTKGQNTLVATFGSISFDTNPTKVVEIPILAHTLTKTDEVAATCTTAGNIEYWTCSECHKLFSDANGETEISGADTVLPAKHVLTKTEAVAATCTSTGTEAYWTCSECHKLFSDENGENEITEPVVIPKLAHTLTKTDEVAATCTSTGTKEYWTCSECNKLFSDENGENEITEPVAIPKLAHTLTKTDEVAATCTTDGHIAYWTCSECHKLFSDANGETEISVADTVIAATGHDWDVENIIWKWYGDTEDMIEGANVYIRCKNDPTEEHTFSKLNIASVKTTTHATCETAGQDGYTVTLAAADAPDGKEHSDFKGVTIPALSHAWGEPTYEWSADGKTCTATRVCANDATHVETETVNATSAVKTPATCTAKGTTTYTATFTNAAFAVQTKDLEDIAAFGHDYGDATYTWADDNSTCTAVHTCKRDASHTESETVNATSAVTTAATCEAKGTTTYTATFTNTAFAVQTKAVENIDALGHAYGAPTYAWSADNSTCTAKMVCANDAAHVVEETVQAASVVKTAATCLEQGTTTYTASFTTAGFETQTEDVKDIPTTEHDIEVHWVWTEKDEGGFNVQSWLTCKNDDGHPMTDLYAEVTSVTTPATCETAGKIVYTATASYGYGDEAQTFTDTKTVEIAALSHAYGAPTYTWSEDNSKCTAKMVCANDAAHVVEETVTASSAVKTPATLTEKGTTTYTATFENPAFEKQTKDVQDIEIITEFKRVEGVSQEAETVINAKIGELEGYSEQSVKYYEVTLEISFDGGKTFVPVTKENMPAEGVVVTLSYPAGTNAQNYDFVVIHVLDDGTTETLTPVKAADGLQVTVKSLSPFAVAYKAAPATQPDNTKGATQQNGGKAAPGRAPHTGDSSPIVLWTVALLASTAGAVLVLRRKYDR